MFRNIDRLFAGCCPIIGDIVAHESYDNLLMDDELGPLERIGALCSANRRSVWMRLHGNRDRLQDTEGGIEWIEIHAGREGDDFWMVIDRENPQFGDLLDLFCRLRWCVQS